MPSKKRQLTPEELAARVKEKMIESCPDVDLNELMDMDQLEKEIAFELHTASLVIKPTKH